METENNDQIEKIKRNLILRILAAIFWLLVTMLAINMLTGGIVGGMAGANVGTGMSMSEAFEAGAASGQQASTAFMNKHGGLAVGGSKFKKPKGNGKRPVAKDG